MEEGTGSNTLVEAPVVNGSGHAHNDHTYIPLLKGINNIRTNEVSNNID